MADVFAIYEKLWRLVQHENVFIEYRVLGNGEGGYFHARAGELKGNGKPQRPLLAIHRPWAKSPNTEPTRESNAPVGNPQPNLLAELITLAHEAGHMFSWKGRTPPERWAQYHEIEKRRHEIARALNDDAEAAQLVEPERTRQLGARMFEKLNSDERALIIEEEDLASAIHRARTS
jgi:hypothetical protein